MKTLFLGTASVLVLAGAADARELRVAPATPPSHPAHYMYERLGEYLDEESGGEMTIRILGPEVVALPQIKDALQTGLVEIANFLPLYFPAGLDTVNVAGDLALLGRNPHAMALAMTEYVVECNVCREEFAAEGMIFLGAGSSDVYQLMTTTAVESPSDLQGLRLRSGGAPYSRWAESFGAEPVNIGVGDQFEAMSQGTIDGTMASVVDLLSYRLIDVVSNLNMIPIGTYHDTSNFTVGLSVWQSLSDEERRWIGNAAAQANLDMTDRWAYQLPAEAQAALDGSSITVVEPSQELLQASSEFVTEDEARIRENQGDPATAFSDLVTKWEGIVEEVGEDDLDGLKARAMEEIWADVDFATYGM